MISVILYDDTLWLFPITGLLLQLSTCLTSPVSRQSLDMLASFFWILITILMPFKELKLLKIHLKNEYFAVEFITQYHVVSCFSNSAATNFVFASNNMISTFLTKMFYPNFNLQIVGLTVIIGLMNLRSSSFTVSPKPTVSLKKLESPSNKNIQLLNSPPNLRTMTPFTEEKTIKREKIEMKQCRSPVNITNLLMTPVSVETPMPIKPTIFKENST